MNKYLMSKFVLPTQAGERLAQLGQRIRLARIRRGWSVTDAAGNAGINRNTLTALELGKPGTAVAVYFTILWVLGLDQSWTQSLIPTPICTAGSSKRLAVQRARASPGRRATVMTSKHGPNVCIQKCDE